MIFDRYHCSTAEGVILAHTLSIGGKALRKGRCLSRADLDELQRHGIEQVSGVRLEPDDIDEDQAALAVARALAGTHIAIGQPVAGRCYLYAQCEGLAVIDRQVIDAINLCDVGIVIATLAEEAECLQQQAVASIKVIPFAVPRAQLQRCLALADDTPGAIALRAYQTRKVALILTVTAGLKESMLRSTSRVTRARVTALGGEIVFEKRCDHSEPALSAVLAAALAQEVDLVLISGASVTVDPADIVPSAIVQCGGTVDHFGMPVEPGNMLLLAHVGGCPIINLPGCSRSPKLNGLDWVMARLAAGLSMGKPDILTMGVGGLVKDVSHRWRMREQRNLSEQRQPPPRVAAIVLGAGSSSRMGAQNKLLATVGGVPMLQRVVDAAAQADLVSTTVVTGCAAEEVQQLLRGQDVKLVHNPRHQDGIAGSLQLGLSSLTDDLDGVIILLADMPLIQAAHINQLIAEFNPANERDIVAPIRAGRLGNPILWSLRYIPAMMKLHGDRGARPLLAEFATNVWEVPMGDDTIFMDVDTPQALLEANQYWEAER